MMFPQCVICVNSKATMQTWPCGHQVVCRKCLVRTIQMAVSRRSLPLRCVVCRARVLRLKRSSEVSGSGGGGGHNAAAGSATESKTGAASRSHSLPIKLRRRHAAGTVAVRSRSMGTGKPGRLRRSAVGGGVNQTGLGRPETRQSIEKRSAEGTEQIQILAVFTFQKQQAIVYQIRTCRERHCFD
ncbi:Zinc finger, RING-type,Zinc finger, RING/FYVE/PHD-type [Cinara cedri]|uniref:Zinc finger, RING-type,Zinc finger, RING/FYVE/PHD-type n=1 Tax=Cinara cedri TaxID=506608 RepID=A0A5E4MH31_9HEMI|nr:Zinc finger, RING-type,Zinc finger, RING/FYVE/PHD-type [Cinara cedri]